MEDDTSPYNWISTARDLQWAFSTVEEVLQAVNNPLINAPQARWWADLTHVGAVAREAWFSEDVLECYARILCQALEVPRDCNRDLSHARHDLRIFTNPRALQVYCCHSALEKLAFNNLVKDHFWFNYYRRDNAVNGQNYEEYTREAYYEAKKSLVWECILPDGIDMEALSPRDANAHLRAKQAAAKLKPPVPKISQKEKDHPPPPPAEVREPPCSDRRNGAIYRTGKCLGKGGFAICYEGQLASTKQLYALKMVKSHMPMKKMEQKVVSAPAVHDYTD